MEVRIVDDWLVGRADFLIDLVIVRYANIVVLVRIWSQTQQTLGVALSVLDAEIVTIVKDVVIWGYDEGFGAFRMTVNVNKPSKDLILESLNGRLIYISVKIRSKIWR